MIKVAYCNVKDIDFEKAYDLLPQERKEKMDNFIFDRDKKLSAGAYLLAKKMLDDEGKDDAKIEFIKDGKPYISNYEDTYFNVSHSGKIVACAISEREVGIDVEIKDPTIDLKISKNFFYNSEYENIRSSDEKVDEFFKYWVLKESYMKYTGLGFELDTDKFEIIIDEDNDEIKVKNMLDDLKENDEKVKFSFFDLGRYKLAVCSEYKVDECIEYNIDDIL